MIMCKIFSENQIFGKYLKHLNIRKNPSISRPGVSCLIQYLKEECPLIESLELDPATIEE